MNRRGFFRLIGLASVAAPMAPMFARGGLAGADFVPIRMMAGEAIVGNPVVSEFVINSSGMARGSCEYERAAQLASMNMRESLNNLSVELQVQRDLAIIEGRDAEHNRRT